MIAWPSARDWIFSVKAFVAAMLALYIALALGLPRPYWAMATVYVVSHPLTGATRSKALYRCLGTLLGGAGAIAMVPPLVNEPALLMGAVALWTGTLLYVALMHRTPRSYVFMLAAYTLPMIALPAVDNPATIFDVAAARVQEITLGIVCASLVGALVLPGKVSTVLRDKSAAWMKDATAWALDMLSGDPATSVARHGSRHRLAADILMLDQLISQLSYDAGSDLRVKEARELRGRMTMLLPVLSSLTALVDALLKYPGGVPARLAADMTQVADWIRGGADDPAPVLPPIAALVLRADTPATAPATAPATPVARTVAAVEAGTTTLAAAAGHTAEQADLVAAIVETAELRLRSLIELWQDCASLRRRIGDAHPVGDWKPRFERWAVGGARHYDHGMLLFSTVSAALAIFSMGMLWIWTGWADGAGAVILGAVSICFFAALDEPAPMIRSFFTWNVVCVVVATAYIFVILPNAHAFGLLVAMFAVPYLIIGVMMANPRLALIALPLGVVTATNIGIQGSYSLDFNSFFNNNISGVVGILFALVWTLLTRPFGTKVALRRLLRSSWQDIATNAVECGRADYHRLRGRTLDRLGQLVPRVAAADSEVSTDGFSEIRVELSTLALHRDLPRLEPADRGAIESVMQSIAAFYRERLADEGQTPSRELHDKIVSAVRGLTRHADGVSRDARAALVEMHVAMFGPMKPVLDSESHR
jgi:uncharacterized membrane protein YccC